MPSAARREVTYATSAAQVDVDLTDLVVVQEARMEGAACLGVAPSLVQLLLPHGTKLLDDEADIPEQMQLVVAARAQEDEELATDEFLTAMKSRVIRFNIDKTSSAVVNGTGLRELPEEIKRFRNLEILCATDNFLESLLAKIGELRRLRHLNLHNNHVVGLPRTFVQLGWLEKVYLQGNQLRRLPEDIGRLRSLTLLCLDNNQLRSLPESFGNLYNLRVLRFKKQCFGDLAADLRTAPKASNFAPRYE